MKQKVTTREFSGGCRGGGGGGVAPLYSSEPDFSVSAGGNLCTPLIKMNEN
jgi:hypothetical protein